MGVALGSVFGLILMLVAVVAAIAIVILVVVPLIAFIARAFGFAGRGLGRFTVHIFDFVTGVIGDFFRLLSAIPVLFILAPMTLFSIVIGRWSAAGHFARSVQHEFAGAGAAFYRIVLSRPLRLIGLSSILEGVEHRVPNAFREAPGRDRPGRRNRFEGYTITGSLKGGGSGAKLYIAEPDDELKRRRDMPDQVVIKSFALQEGSALPQIVRESRALESARKLGAVVDHGMDDGRFWYIMPYHDGDHLGVVTRRLHEVTDGKGLSDRALREGLGYIVDLATALQSYHSEGLWHKDVKPDNIIVHGGNAHVVDLGLVTPLRSAMTLTTHGTEYFRDPELVRQALRGVKVHQVNGAKFDVFGIGAVLYFLIENDFPAHGPLSRFNRRSPDAVKWIVRRAMADYNHRYETAVDVQRDLQAVLRAADPHQVRPADLPSMRGLRGSDMAEDVDAAPNEHVAAAFVARDAIAAAAVGDDANSSSEPESTSVGASEKVADEGIAANTASKAPVLKHAVDGDGKPIPARRRLAVMNWWTGRYAVRPVEAGDEKTAGVPLAHGITPPAMRVPAREQRRSAHRRAAAMRSTARQRSKNARHAPRRDYRRHPMLAAFAVITVVALMIGTAGITIFSARSSYEGPRLSPGSATDYAAGLMSERSTKSNRRTVLLLPELNDAGTGFTVDASDIQTIRDGYAEKNFNVVELSQHDDASFLRDAYHHWIATNSSEESCQRLEDALEEVGLYGFVAIRKAGIDNHLDDRLIYSAREDASGRKWTGLPQAAPPRPMLVINDHPDRFDRDVADEIDAELSGYRNRGWMINNDDAAEARLRTVLPIRIDVEHIELTQAMLDMFESLNVSGVMRIFGRDADDVRLQVILPQGVGARASGTQPVTPAPMAPKGPAMPGSSLGDDTQGLLTPADGGRLELNPGSATKRTLFTLTALPCAA